VRLEAKGRYWKCILICLLPICIKLAPFLKISHLHASYMFCISSICKCNLSCLLLLPLSLFVDARVSSVSNVVEGKVFGWISMQSVRVAVTSWNLADDLGS
jgi:hypothetical protein